jgi:hypothetical protein
MTPVLVVRAEKVASRYSLAPGRPFLPGPTMITFAFGESANFSVASIPFHSFTRSFNVFPMID